MQKRSGLLVVISAPSGGGKTTVIRSLLKRGDPHFAYSVSATTRPRRQNEVDGRDYIFLQEEAFRRKIDEGAFIEWAHVHNHLYGTLCSTVETLLDDGKIVLLDLDVQGGLEIKKKYGDEALLIFIKPPSLEELERRLRTRNTEHEQAINTRLSAVPEELAKSQAYDHIVVNFNLDETVEAVNKIVKQTYELKHH